MHVQLEEGSLLALFYYCDVSVNYQMDELNKIMRVMPDNLDRRSEIEISSSQILVLHNQGCSYTQQIFLIEFYHGRQLLE